MARMSNRTARIVKWSALPAALLVSGLVVSQASYSAFESRTSNETNNWKAGAVEISDNDGGAAMFNVSNIKPGDWGTNCITVTANKVVENTTVALKVVDTTTSPAANANLAAQLQFKVAHDATCPTTLAPIATGAGGSSLPAISAPETQVGGLNWAPTKAMETRGYRIDWTFVSANNNTTDNLAAGQGVSANFVWTATSGSGVQKTQAAFAPAATAGN